MKIRYTHASEQKKEKVFDTIKSYKNMMWAINDPETKLYKKTQKEWDESILETFAEDKKKGVVLDYEIIEF